MPDIKISDEVRYKTKSPAAGVEGAILAQRGRVKEINGNQARVEWRPSVEKGNPIVFFEWVPLANLAKVDDGRKDGQSAD